MLHTGYQLIFFFFFETWLSIDYYRKLIKQCQFFIQESSSWWLLCRACRSTGFIWYNRVLTENRADNLFVTAFTKKKRTYSGKRKQCNYLHIWLIKGKQQSLGERLSLHYRIWIPPYLLDEFYLVLLTLPLLWTRLAPLVLVLALSSNFSSSLLNVFSVCWRFWF